jgi:hypothetical protein
MTLSEWLRERSMCSSNLHDLQPVTEGADQLYSVPAGTSPLVPLTGVIANGASLQAASVIRVIAGFGFTVISTMNGVPEQVPDSGVTV